MGFVISGTASEGIISVVGEDGDIGNVVGCGQIFVEVVGTWLVIFEVSG